MKLAFVVQRYGPTINGGAELHARYIAERLSRHVEVEVLTTCASDYVSWRNEFPAGVERINNVQVRRFRVKHERDPIAFGRQSEQVFSATHSVSDELDWLDAEGPTCPALVDYLSTHAGDYDYCLFFSYRYYHAYHGARAVPGRAILIPTAERDAAIGLSIFAPVFRDVRALMYNSPEERTMIQALADNASVPSVVVGVGSDVPANPQPARFRQKHNVRGPFAVYVGRIDANKGCRELFAYFQQYVREGAGQLTLVLLGHSLLDIPQDPRIRHLGFVDDTDKFDAIAGSELLIMPSYFESLSMVALEAWALGRPVLANARCDVLKGQCLRSNAGLFYDGAAEFVEALRAIEHNRWIAGSLGRNGRQFYRDNYDWPVIERKYLDMIGQLAKSGTPAATATALPGWLERRKRTVPAAQQILDRLPSGPTITPDMRTPRPGTITPPVPRRQTPPEMARPPHGRERRFGGPRRGPRPGQRR